MGFLFKKKTFHELIVENYKQGVKEYELLDTIIKKFAVIEKLVEHEATVLKLFRDRFLYSEKLAINTMNIINEVKAGKANINELNAVSHDIKGLFERLKYQQGWIKQELDSRNEWPSKHMADLFDDVKKLRKNTEILYNTFSKQLKVKGNSYIFVTANKHGFDMETESITLAHIVKFVNKLYKNLANFERDEEHIEKQISKKVLDHLPDAIEKAHGLGYTIQKKLVGKVSIMEVELAANNLFTEMDSIIGNIKKIMSNNTIAELEIFLKRGEKALEQAFVQNNSFIEHLKVIQKIL